MPALSGFHIIITIKTCIIIAHFANSRLQRYFDQTLLRSGQETLHIIQREDFYVIFSEVIPLTEGGS